MYVRTLFFVCVTLTLALGLDTRLAAQASVHAFWTTAQFPVGEHLWPAPRCKSMN